MPTLIQNSDSGWSCGRTPDIDWTDAEELRTGEPLKLACDDEPNADMLSAPVIAIDFPSFNDGRGLSLAVLLRTRFDYTGDLRAVGDVHEDILHYMVRCGFTSFALPEDRNAETALGCLTPYSECYQGSAVDPEPAFRRLSRGSVHS